MHVLAGKWLFDAKFRQSAAIATNANIIQQQLPVMLTAIAPQSNQWLFDVSKRI
jgi:hypothetical protein